MQGRLAVVTKGFEYEQAWTEVCVMVRPGQVIAVDVKEGLARVGEDYVEIDASQYALLKSRLITKRQLKKEGVTWSLSRN